MARRVALPVTRAAGLESPLDPRFGRAPVFVIVDLDSGGVEKEIENEFAEGAHGAGTGAAGLMAGERVDTVIAGTFGPKAYEALEKLGIEMRIAPGDLVVRRALEMLASGSLAKMEIKVY